MGVYCSSIDACKLLSDFPFPIDHQLKINVEMGKDDSDDSRFFSLNQRDDEREREGHACFTCVHERFKSRVIPLP